MKASDREQLFNEIAEQHRSVISKVCFLYQGPGASFDDLYQEVLINLWQGIDSFRGEAKMSTWIYRTALNTCISWHRRNDKHTAATLSLDDIVIEPANDDSVAETAENFRNIMALIARLGPLDKAIVTLWLDDNSYDDIARITGLTVNNVAVKLHRIKDKLSSMAAKSGLKI